MSSTAINGQQLVRNLASGRFAKGNRGGGRPPGARDKSSLVREEIEAHLMETDVEAGKRRIRAALDAVYETDKKAYVRLATSIVPRPAAPRVEEPPQSHRFHVSDLFPLLVERDRQLAAAAAATARTQLLPGVDGAGNPQEASVAPAHGGGSSPVVPGSKLGAPVG